MLRGLMLLKPNQLQIIACTSAVLPAREFYYKGDYLGSCITAMASCSYIFFHLKANKEKVVWRKEKDEINPKEYLWYISSIVLAAYVTYRTPRVELPLIGASMCMSTLFWFLTDSMYNDSCRIHGAFRSVSYLFEFMSYYYIISRMKSLK